MAPRSRSRVGLGLALAAALPGAAQAKVHHLTITNERRFAFSIESFGFLPGGTVSVHVHDVSASPADAAHTMGFVLYPTTTESRIAEQVELLVADRGCALDASNEGVVKVNISDPATWARDTPMETVIERPGLYDLLFTHCAPAGGRVAFSADIVFQSPGGHYLSAGEMPLPTVRRITLAALRSAHASRGG